jgi:hypothetical protein
MFKSIRIIAGAVVISMTAACNSISTNLSSSRFESPEVPGHLRWRLAGGGGTDQQVTFTYDASDRPISFANVINVVSEFPLLKGSLGLSDRFEIGVRYNFPSQFLAKAKFQVVGDAGDIARKGNFSLALTAGAGADYTSRAGNQEGTFGPGGYGWSASSTTSIYDFSLIAGVRPGDNFLIFVSPFVSTYGISGNINQAASDNGQSPAANYPLIGNGVSYGGSLGLQFFFGHRKNLSIMTDLTEQVLQWSTIGTQANLGGGVIFEVLL